MENHNNDFYTKKFFDKENKGFITRLDFSDMLEPINMDNISDEDMQFIVDEALRETAEFFGVEPKEITFFDPEKDDQYREKWWQHLEALVLENGGVYEEGDDELS